jgi:hypothetical protein
MDVDVAVNLVWDGTPCSSVIKPILHVYGSDNLVLFPGTYSAIEGATSLNDCTPCELGTYSETVGAISSNTCTSCGAGKYGNTTGIGNELFCYRCPAVRQCLLYHTCTIARFSHLLDFAGHVPNAHQANKHQIVPEVPGWNVLQRSWPGFLDGLQDMRPRDVLLVCGSFRMPAVPSWVFHDSHLMTMMEFSIPRIHFELCSVEVSKPIKTSMKISPCTLF